MEAVTMLRLRQGSGSPILGSFSVAVAQADQGSAEDAGVRPTYLLELG
jgi:hypothetical protein